MRVLLTNDDSIHSAALQRLVAALLAHGDEVVVAAPDTEKSGVGRACGLTRDITVSEFDGLGCRAWMISGTPLDCVNIALSHLIERPDVVISGINWGVNVSVPVIFSSGTVGGAIEGAAFNIPALAVSQCLPGQAGQYIQKKIDFLAHEGLMRCIDIAVVKTISYAHAIAGESGNIVHNINFPYPLNEYTEEEMTKLSNIMHGTKFPAYCSLYRKVDDGYRFSIEQDMLLKPEHGTDIDALLREKISHSVIDLKRLC